MKTLALLGGGSYGTTLAQIFAKNFEKILIVAKEQEVCDSINKEHINNLYLPHTRLDNKIKSSCNINDTLGYDLILITTPTQYICEYLKDIKLSEHSILLICSKGIDIKNEKLISQVLKENLKIKNKIGVLAGPSLAKEIKKGLPSGITVAMDNITEAKHIAQKLTHPGIIRSYYNDDVIGSQLGGAIKNIIAVATGISSGLQQGHNFRALILTMALKEFKTIFELYGGKESTISGLTGLGDLILTATSPKSRNYAFGEKIGELGRFNKSKMASLNILSEGYYTTKILYKIIKENDLHAPICEAIYKICYEDRSSYYLVDTLMLHGSVITE